MSYFSTQIINLSDALKETVPLCRVLLAEPEDALYGIYARHLREHRFVVHRSAHLPALGAAVAEHQPSLLVVSLHFSEGLAAVLAAMRTMRRNNPALHIMSVGSAGNPVLVKDILSSGISSHVDRALSRPQDIAIIAKTLLHQQQN